MTEVLKADGLTKSFGSKTALNSLNLVANEGEIICLLGANGAGKTTTINLFLGFLEPTSGAAIVDGKNVAENTEYARSCLAYVPEQVNLYPTLTGLENLSYFAKLANKQDLGEDKLYELIDRVGLDRKAASDRVENYSKGMRQKIGLAIALAKNAKALLLDEPLSGLDPKAANEFCALIRKLADEGTAVLMATHDLFRAKEIGDRIGIMKAGNLVDVLSAKDINHNELEQIYLNHMHDTDTNLERVA
ncbi:ABC transporter ATP-binding protein [Pseudemcibacter aquimaris]|uniref:ABC transporter ATP-binding protein n=1 Tax=Pseudemcibacter aquimaris TaxID=2857064 RepID=UPI002012F813|nr:ABC transporter ATP-binding protein [Pseudemcibacter aquimaris]MCC3861405.1 ABC transporter ATP-binding protein [Pseudemcibacter aquimaris]WDU58175.1 ABC transporter ATP-binding protein [Pseudemcibacter aquimaris]